MLRLRQECSARIVHVRNIPCGSNVRCRPFTPDPTKGFVLENHVAQGSNAYLHLPKQGIAMVVGTVKNLNTGSSVLHENALNWAVKCLKPTDPFIASLVCLSTVDGPQFNS
jgi:hypothetical protein